MSFLEWPMIGTFITPPPNPNGGGGSTPPSGHGSTTAAGSVKPLTAAEINNLRLACSQMYNHLTQQTGASVPKVIWEMYLKSRGHYDSAQLTEYMRTSKDKAVIKAYLMTRVAQARINEYKDRIHAIMGDSYKSFKDMPGLIAQYALGADTVTFEDFFKKVVAKSAAFAQMFPGFRGWFAQQTGGRYSSAVDAVTGYSSYVTQLHTWYHDTGMTGDPSAALIQQALAGNWDEKTYKAAVAASPDYANSPIGQARDVSFKQQWDAVFAGTAYEGNYDLTLLNRFRTEPDLDFNFLVQTDSGLGAKVEETHAGYGAWQDAQAAAGADASTINIFSYLRSQKSASDFYRGAYQDILEDPNAVIPPELLARAIAGKWSSTLFNSVVKKEDHAYTGTQAYKDEQVKKAKDVATFTSYWHSLFGQDATPDADLANLYATGTFSDPSDLFNQVRNTREFQSQYGNWDEFAAAQRAQGTNAVNNPLLYKQYQAAFTQAFADQGIQTPVGLERQFLASGVDSTDFANNIAQFAEQGAAYQWQSGEAPDMATVAGIGDKTAGGDLRKKLAAAIKQHQQYLNSKFQTFNTDQTPGSIKQSI